MAPELFRKIVDDCIAVGGIKSAAFFGDGEPLLHPEFFSMVSYAQEQGAFEKTNITTNASLINETIAEKLVESGLAMVRISLYGLDDETYLATTRQKKFNFSDILQRILLLSETKKKAGLLTPFIYVKVMEGLSSPERMNEFHKQIMPHVDGFGFEYGHDWDGSFDLSQKGKRLEGLDINCCPKAWYTLNIAHNGDVRICCIDWSHATTIGNIKHHSLADIWNGPGMQTFRQMHVNGISFRNTACNGCTFYKRDSLNPDADNIDSVVQNDPERAASVFSPN